MEFKWTVEESGEHYRNELGTAGAMVRVKEDGPYGSKYIYEGWTNRGAFDDEESFRRAHQNKVNRAYLIASAVDLYDLAGEILAYLGSFKGRSPAKLCEKLLSVRADARGGI